MIKVDTLLKYAMKMDASDLHLVPGTPPVLRIHGQIRAIDAEGRKIVTTEELVETLMNSHQLSEFRNKRHLGFSFTATNLGRFRVEVYYDRGKMAAAIRLTSRELPALETLGLPSILEELCRKPNGLVLVTGPTGTGKTTTLASMVDVINRELACKITTIEDPIEMVHQNKRSIIVQQEVFQDTPSFAKALVHVLRQDPDVVVVGEMRDLETIQTALTAAETGHLVLATLHTSSAGATIERVIDVFPPHQQQQIRIQLAGCLRAIVSQRLLPRMDIDGRALAYEVLVNTPAVKNVIREAKAQQLASLMQSGGDYGMCTMDSSIERLYKSGMISYDVALENVTSEKALRGGP